MAKYNPVTPELLEELKKVVGAVNVKTVLKRTKRRIPA